MLLPLVIMDKKFLSVITAIIFWLFLISPVPNKRRSHDFLYHELTNAAISIELKFSAALAGNTDIFSLGRKTFSVFLRILIRIGRYPKSLFWIQQHKYRWSLPRSANTIHIASQKQVWRFLSSSKYPFLLHTDTFIVINSENSISIGGRHWEICERWIQFYGPPRRGLVFSLPKFCHKTFSVNIDISTSFDKWFSHALTKSKLKLVWFILYLYCSLF